MTQDTTIALDELIRELSSEVGQLYRWIAEEAGLNQTDLFALFFVRNAEGSATPKRLRENLGLTSGATAILLNRLEARQFIQRTPHPTDRRGVLIALGPAAERSGILGLRDYVARMNASVIARYSEAELSIVRRFFSDLMHNTREALVAARSAGQMPAAVQDKGDQPAS